MTGDGVVTYHLSMHPATARSEMLDGNLTQRTLRTDGDKASLIQTVTESFAASSFAASSIAADSFTARQFRRKTISPQTVSPRLVLPLTVLPHDSFAASKFYRRQFRRGRRTVSKIIFGLGKKNIGNIKKLPRRVGNVKKVSRRVLSPSS